LLISSSSAVWATSGVIPGSTLLAASANLPPSPLMVVVALMAGPTLIAATIVI